MKNFVSEDSLRAFHPRISEYVGKGRVDFSFQIGEGFRQSVDALRARGLKARQLSKPLDLLRPYQSASTQNALTSSGAKTADESFAFIEGIDGFIRFVVSVSQAGFGGGQQYVFVLEGSDDVNVDLANPPTNWRELARLTASATGDLTALLSEEARWYRLRLVLTTNGQIVVAPTETTQVTFTAWLQETQIERLTTYKALALVMASFSVDPADVWAARAREANAAFETALAAVEVNVDRDEDNIPEEDDRESGFGTVFSR